MLTLAREARGFSQSELSEKLKHSTHSNVNRWEQEKINVAQENITQLSHALGFPAEFFYQIEDILPPTYYRKRDTVSAKLLNSIDANLNIYRFNISKLFNAFNQEASDLPSLPLSKEITPEKAAQQLRRLWKVEKGPINNLTQLLEQHRIFIVSVDFETERVDSRSVFIDHKYAVIFTNKLLLGDRLRFTLAYELGHLIMHTSGSPSFGEEAGHEANLFAAEFLMPEKDILSDLKDTAIKIPVLGELKKKWKVSMQSLLYRADSLGLIDYNQKRYLLTQFNQLKIRRREPIEFDITIEKPVLLKSILSLYRSKQKLSLKGIAKFFYLTEQEFLRRFAE